MKFDIVRAWKDDTYRQNLSNEQINELPAHPAGELELSNDELEFVNGGFGPGFGFGFGPAASSAASSVRNNRFHSLAVGCNEAIFSTTFTSGFNVLSGANNAFCIANFV